MSPSSNRSRLMWASFLTLVASGVGFATRAAMGGVWEVQFNIGATEFGEIMGAGFLGFGIMIFFGGILTEKFGYKNLLLLAFILHLISAVMLFAARPAFERADAASATQTAYWILFVSTFIFSIAQGLYEAVINPMIAQLYPENQTHYLNILHAGWPAGMIIGGLIAASFIGNDAWISTINFWEIPLACFSVFVIMYGVLAFPIKFPQTVSEKSKVNFATLFSCFASPIFLALIVLHACIGYVELGVDSWVSKLMTNLLPNAIVILVYTSFLMFILRFFAGPIVHRLNPVGLLLMSSVIACIGLFWLGSNIESVATIFIAATVYSMGKAFFWPTMLGIAGERFPQSGAIAMGALGAAGMLTVGLLAGKAIGYKQEVNMASHLKEKSSETYERFVDADQKKFLWFPEYQRVTPALAGAATGSFDKDGKVDTKKFDDAIAKQEDETVKARMNGLKATAETDFPLVKEADIYGGRRALTLTAYVPGAMAVGFLLLLVYFSSIGGYKRLKVNENGEVVPDENQHGH
ncbi:MAG: MFS transporter [Pirellulaceae bacterium]